jgi:phosphoglycolate phosphatase
VKYDFLIFDLDGTLIDSENDLAFAVNLLRKEYKFNPLSVEEVRSFVGNGAKVLLEKAIPQKKDKMPEMFEKFSGYYSKCLLNETKPYDGVCQMLESLSDIPKAVLSNKPEIFSKEIIKGLGWEKYFVEVFGGDSAATKKPAPEVLFELIKRTKLNPKKAMMIGDGVNDIKIAKAANINSLAVLYGFTDAQTIRDLKPDFTAETPKDIADIVLNV